MRENTKTAAKASYTTATIDQAEPVTFTDDGQAVTIRVCGKAYNHLSKIASTMNALPWTDDDNSPLTVLDFWLGSFFRRIAKTPEEDYSNSVLDVIFDIVDGINTGADDGTPEDASRREELRDALHAIKF